MFRKLSELSDAIYRIKLVSLDSKISKFRLDNFRQPKVMEETRLKNSYFQNISELWRHTYTKRIKTTDFAQASLS